MTAHEIGHHKLLLAQLFVETGVLGDEALVHLVPGLAHHIQNRVCNVLRSHF